MLASRSRSLPRLMRGSPGRPRPRLMSSTTNCLRSSRRRTRSLPGAVSCTSRLTSAAPALPTSSCRAAGKRVQHVHPAPGEGLDGFRYADRIFEHEFVTPPVQHVSMEPHAAVAVFESNRLTVTTCTQTPYAVRDALAYMFDMPRLTGAGDRAAGRRRLRRQDIRQGRASRRAGGQVHRPAREDRPRAARRSSSRTPSTSRSSGCAPASPRPACWSRGRSMRCSTRGRTPTSALG